MHTRDALDEAVRRLALSAGDLTHRLRASVQTLTKLTADDFPDAEDRELHARIQRRTHELTLAEARHHSNGSTAAAETTSSSTLEAIASDILDLRDNTMGRAIREAQRGEQTSS